MLKSLHRQSVRHAPLSWSPHVPDFIYSFQLDSLSHLADMKIIGTLSLGIGMATDVVIAASLSFFLWNLRTGHRKCVSSTSYTSRSVKSDRVMQR